MDARRYADLNATFFHEIDHLEPSDLIELLEETEEELSRLEDKIEYIREMIRWQTTDISDEIDL